MTTPSNLVRTQLLARLADATVGFNPNLVTAAAQYQTLPFAIDFGVNSKSLIVGRVDLNDVLSSGPMKFPLMNVYCSVGANANLQKFSLFSGKVQAGVEIHSTFKSSQALRNYESAADAIEHAFIRTVNQERVQNWSREVIYNGEVSYERKQVKKGGENWLQTLYFRLTFDVVVSQQ